MEKFYELLASMKAKIEEKQTRRTEMGGGLKTADGEDADEHMIECVIISLSSLPSEMLERLGRDKLFRRLAENFIRSNTEEDINSFVTHNLVTKMINKIFR